MSQESEQRLTAEVLVAYGAATDPRQREIFAALIKHLHAFAREVRLSEAEWFAGIDFLTRTGQKCTDKRQEFILLSDLLGLSTMMVLMNADTSAGATESTVLGPFFSEHAPEYKNGDYTKQPPMLKIANTFYGIATNGGTLNYQNIVPTFDKADGFVDKALAAPMTADANDFLYQWDSSRGFDASPNLDKITAALVAVNAADDERNPVETGVMEREIKRVKNGKLLLIPASNDSRGHGTTGQAKFYKQAIEELLKTAPQKAM